MTHLNFLLLLLLNEFKCFIDDYEEVDLDRLRNDDKYCNRFILHKKGNFDEALKMVDEALKWRKSFGCKSKYTYFNVNSNFIYQSLLIDYF